MNEKDYWVGFSAVSGMGPAKFKKLLEEFKTAEAAWNSTRPRLVASQGEAFAGKLGKFRADFSIEKYLEELKRKNVWFITSKDQEYPKLLKEIKNPPFVLYGKGNPSTLSIRSGHSVAVVGARRTTEYGREVTRLLTRDLTLAGFTIVSGLALGVDAISHMTALENGGKTIAVLGSGVDYCFPGENVSIYNEILKTNNCIISEFPLGMKPAKWTFPARNRIVAGLSQAVLVTEGAEDSGSLITAEFALKFGRKVFAVPGPITSQMSKGPYKLISKGAKLATTANDILKELKLEARNSKSEIISKSKIQKCETKEEQAILDLLQNEPLHFDELVRRTGLNSSKLSSALSLMEIKGLIKSSASGKFSI